MFTYRIVMVDPAITRFDVYFEVYQDKNFIAKDYIQIPTDSMLNVASDGRNDYINKMVSSACRKYIVTNDVKNDFNSLIGIEVQLDSPTYETKADIQAIEATPVTDPQLTGRIDG